MTFEQKISEEIKRIYRKICSLWAAVETLQTDVTTITADVTNLKNNELKITYYAIVTGASGTITPPTGATFNSDEFGNSGNSILSRINGAKNLSSKMLIFYNILFVTIKSDKELLSSICC